MTEQEAIEKLKTDNCVECGYSDNATTCDYGACGVAIATRMAIKALEEIQQYRAIGTVEDCRAAVEKQKAKRPTKIYSDLYPVVHYYCPNCGRRLGQRGKNNCILFRKELYCLTCGQRIDWSGEE